MAHYEVFKDLKTIMRNHYLFPKVGRYLGGKVAWVTSGAPVEPLVAMGITPIYPENHGAICGARKVAPDLHRIAEGLGYSSELCSYARADIGAQKGGRSPVGGLPRPHMLVACNNICNTVTKWFEQTAAIQKVPLFVVDTPLVHEKLEEHTVEYVSRQIEAMIAWAQRVTGRDLDMDKLREVGNRSQEHINLWTEVLYSNAEAPAVFSCFDAFVFMMPIVSLRGQKPVSAFYRKLLKELADKRRAGKFLNQPEKKRVIWDNIPIWFQIGPLSRLLQEHGVSLVADTYTHAWAGHVVDTTNPIQGLARCYTDIYLNRSVTSRVDFMIRMLERYNADGFIMHSNHSCKPYSVGQYPVKDEITRRTGKPGVVIEGDMTDPRFFTEAQSVQRLQAFLEGLA